MGSANCSTMMMMILVVTSLFLLFLSPTVTSDFLAPLLSPAVGNICKLAECGKGNCKIPTSKLMYECECESGWKQTPSGDNNGLSFLPCVVPNCTLDNSCSMALPPAQVQPNPTKGSIFDPCEWAYCGGGKCNKSTGLSHTCECLEGYYNLLNVTSFPCFKQCAIGADCQRLGITTSNATASAPNLADSGSSQASMLQLQVLHLLLVFIVVVPHTWNL